jgi:hypothetical protein
MPCWVEKIATWTSAHSPNRIQPARRRSVRGARRVSHTPATSEMPASGSSQAICPPTCSLNMRHRPGVPPNDAPPPPLLEPSTRPKPL